MDKAKLERRLKESADGAMFVTCHQVETFMGYGATKTLELLKGTEAVELHGRRKYFIPDVVERIIERRVLT